MNRFFQGLLIFGVVGLVGCGGPSDAPTRVPVSGEVTFDGEPIAQGDIIFRPEMEGGVTDAAKIKDGKYEMEVVPGKYRVEIRALREVGPAKTLDSGEAGPNLEPYIPENYNDKSDLSAEVKESGNDPFNFTLKSK